MPFSSERKFNPNENNTYNDYFELYDDWSEVRTGEKTSEEVYKEHLQTAPKDKLIDIAIEGHSKYQWANDLAYDRQLEIEELQSELKKCNDEVALYNNIAYNSKIACLITIIVCALIIGSFYIYQFIKFRLKKYADKIRKETIDELKNNQ